MAKRIVSGIFILTALGALGVILAGAMTSGEQLIVRFLTAVTVAALALYVISDLRLQNEQDESPVERNDSETTRPTAQAPAVMATVTGSHRREQLGRRGREATPQAAPNFEAIEPVTARSRTVALADPTEAVTGSRLVPPAPDPSDRAIPPHPRTGLPIGEHSEPTTSGATPPGSTPPMPAGDSGRHVFGFPEHDGAKDQEIVAAPVGAPAEPAGGPEGARSEATTGRVEAVPEFLNPQDEPATSSPNSSVIATTAFTYSGRLDAVGTEWPPKPPDPPNPAEQAEPEAPVVSVTDEDAAVYVDAVDAPTAELPTLPDLRGRIAYDDESLLAMFDAEIGGDDDDHWSRSVGRRVHLFAVDTAEIPLSEPAVSGLSSPAPDADSSTAAGAAEEVELVEIGEEVVDPADAAEADDPAGDGPGIPTADEEKSAPRPLIRRIEAAEYAAPPRTDHLDLLDAVDPVTTADFEHPVPVPHRQEAKLPDKLTAAIRSGEIQVINSLISQGMLSTSGPITDRDVRTMVYVAFTSNELRKLILAGGTPDGIRAGDLDLGEVELFDESRFAPAPKRLYAGPPAPPVAAPEAVLDLVALEEEAAAAASASSRHGHELDDTELVPTMPTPQHLYRRVDVDRVEQ